MAFVRPRIAHFVAGGRRGGGAGFDRVLLRWCSSNKSGLDFSVESLDFKEVTCGMPRKTLEYILTEEKVHPMKQMSELEQRLGLGRRCFAYFHPNLPHEPLCFVHVALMPNIPGNIHVIIDHEDPVAESEATAAIFYSISSTRPGLALGQHLIKRTTQQLQRENLALEAFSTLSPIPNFCKWLFASPSRPFVGELLSNGEREILRSLIHEEPVPHEGAPEVISSLERPVLKLAAHYVSKVKRESRKGLLSTEIHCPVGNFHLRNGAEAWRLNFLADQSSRGIKNSLGTMINYKYNLESLQSNSQRYVKSGAVCTGSSFQTS